MSAKPESIRLPDGSSVLVRQPVVQEDLDRLVAFYRKLPDEVRNLLRYDVTEAEASRRRLQQVDGRDHWRLIVEIGGAIVADGTLDRQPYGWTRHVAELRAVVDPSCQRPEIGPLLLNELVCLGSAAGIELLTCEAMADDSERIAMLEDAGFTREASLTAFAKDLDGKLHDLVILTNDLEETWRSLAEQLEEMDIGHSRSA